MALDPPGPYNNYHAGHVELLLKSYFRVTGKSLIQDHCDIVALSEKIFHAPFALVSHNTLNDPLFNYGNRTALLLFEMGWREFTSLPSRKSAEAVNRDERERLLNEVREKGFSDNYTGIRISSSGRRFRIEDAVVWNVTDDEGRYQGQAASFSKWQYL